MNNDVTVRWLNPIGHHMYDAPIGDLLASIKQPGTTVQVESFDMPAGTTNLEYSAYQSTIIQRITESARDCGTRGVNALVIGCFDDPGLEPAREISGNTVVVAPCYASFQMATQLANKVSVIVGRQKWIHRMSHLVRGYGFEHNLASFRPLGLRVDEFQANHAVTRARIIEEAQRAVEEDKAEAIILGCTIEFGFFQEVQKIVGVPVIDAVVASFKLAEYQAQMAKNFDWIPSRAWSCEAPPEAEMQASNVFQTLLPTKRIVY